MISHVRLLAALSTVACLAIGASAGTALAAGPAWQPAVATGPTVLPPTQSEVQEIAVDATGGTFTLTFSGQTTAAIAFDAVANGTVASVQTRLEDLSNLAPGDVIVSGGPGDSGATTPYVVSFGGTLANQNVEQMSTNSAVLSGGISQSAAVATLVPGGKGTTTLALYVQNIGGYESSGPLTYKVKLPTGVTLDAAPDGGFFVWSCSGAAGDSEFSCTYSEPVQPARTPLPIKATLKSSGTPGTGLVQTEVSGGGAASASYDLPLTAGATPAPPGSRPSSPARMTPTAKPTLAPVPIPTPPAPASSSTPSARPKGW